MLQLFLPLLVSLLVTAISIPFTIKLAKRFNLMDDPKKYPHPGRIIQRVVPRAGGLPIFLGIVTAILLFIPFDKHIFGIILSLTLLLMVGLLDDFLKDFSPFPRLILQVLAAAVVVSSGIGIAFITNPLGGQLRLDQFVYPFYFFGPHRIILIADILAFLWIVWMMNMINWSKGLDGQMPGIITVAALTIGLLSLKLFNQGDPNQLVIAKLAFITSGTSLGFLFFNWYPARIFPGFSGSTILGFMIAVLSILSGAKLATALLVLLIPTIDFFYTFLRRILAHKSPFFGDQKHLYHLLLQRGFSVKKIALFYILSCVILGLLATNLSTEDKTFVVIAVGIIILGVILWLQFFAKNLWLNLFGHSLEPPDQDNG